VYCNICNRLCKKYEIVENINVDVTSVYSKPTNMLKRNIKFYKCPNCGHGFIDVEMEEDHYLKYSLLNIDDNSMKSGGGSAAFKGAYYEKVLQDLSKEVIDRKKLLDIGCGTGEVLVHANKYFDLCQGIDPSEPECIAAREKGCQVFQGYFGDDFKEENYSAFISTQVFEHLSDPVKILKNAYRILTEGGVGYIDVPNGQKIYRESRYYDIFVEHINYFTTSSLMELALRAGFEVISVAEVLNGNHLGLFVRKNKKHIEFEKCKKNDLDKLKKLFLENKKVSIWGAGIKGRNFIQILSDEMRHRILNIFDNNLALEGCYLEDCTVPIRRPEVEEINASDMIIITAIEYKREIAKELRNKYMYAGKIVCIDE